MLLFYINKKSRHSSKNLLPPVPPPPPPPLQQKSSESSAVPPHPTPFHQESSTSCSHTSLEQQVMMLVNSLSSSCTLPEWGISTSCSHAPLEKGGIETLLPLGSLLSECLCCWPRVLERGNNAQLQPHVSSLCASKNETSHSLHPVRIQL